jgi:hypothetical protein
MRNAKKGGEQPNNYSSAAEIPELTAQIPNSLNLEITN